jgi:pyridoxamine 5'-phosphate oxidase
MEFWQGRENPLHDRICYTLNAKSEWRIARLLP